MFCAEGESFTLKTKISKYLINCTTSYVKIPIIIAIGLNWLTTYFKTLATSTNSGMH